MHVRAEFRRSILRAGKEYAAFSSDPKDRNVTQSPIAMQQPLPLPRPIARASLAHDATASSDHYSKRHGIQTRKIQIPIPMGTDQSGLSIRSSFGEGRRLNLFPSMRKICTFPTPTNIALPPEDGYDSDPATARKDVGISEQVNRTCSVNGRSNRNTVERADLPISSSKNGAITTDPLGPLTRWQYLVRSDSYGWTRHQGERKTCHRLILNSRGRLVRR